VLLDYEPLVGEARLDAYLFNPDTVPRESLEGLLGGGISLPDKPQHRVLYVHSLPPLRSNGLRGAVGRLLCLHRRGSDRYRARAEASGKRVVAPCTWAWWIHDTAAFIAMLVTLLSSLLLVAWLRAPVAVCVAAGCALGVLAALAYLRYACEQYRRGGPHIILYDEEPVTEGAQ
jgi:hypothetical protein